MFETGCNEGNFTPLPTETNISKLSHSTIQSEVEDLFNKFSSLRDKTHKQFTTLINAHNESINNGIKNLVEEVCQLQGQVSIITNEKNVLLETIANLNVEIRQLRSKSPEDNTLSESEQIHHQSTHVLNNSEEENPDEEDHFEETTKLNSETYDEVANVEYKEITDEIINQQQNKYSLNDQNNTSIMADGDLEVKPGKFEEAYEEQNKERNIDCHEYDTSSEDRVCQACNFAFSTIENLNIHLKNIHSNFKVKDENRVNKGELSIPISNSQSGKSKISSGSGSAAAYSAAAAFASFQSSLKMKKKVRV